MAERSEFHHVHASLTAFATADKEDGFMKPLCHFTLVKPCRLARLTQMAEEERVFRSKDRFRNDTSPASEDIYLFSIIQNR